MDELIEKESSMNLEYPMGDRKISMVCYAEDVTIIANLEDDPQKQLCVFYPTAKECNMAISIGKTKTITFFKEPARCKLVIENLAMGQVIQFKHLDITMPRGKSDHKLIYLLQILGASKTEFGKTNSIQHRNSS